MSWYRNLKTLWKLLLGFALVTVILGYVGYTGISGTMRSNESMSTLYERDLVGLSEIKEANTTFGSIGRTLRQAVIEKDPANKQALAQDVDKSDGQLRSRTRPNMNNMVFTKEARKKAGRDAGENIPKDIVRLPKRSSA